MFTTTQRATLYSSAVKVLSGEGGSSNSLSMIGTPIENAVHAAIGEHTIITQEMIEAVRHRFQGIFLGQDDFVFTDEELDDLHTDGLINELKEIAHKAYQAKEESVGSSIMRELERVILLRNVDAKWMDHIDAMTELRNGIGLRAYGQHDPVVEYKREGFDMFDAMIDAIREDTVRMIFLAQVRRQEEPKREQVAHETSASGADDGSEMKPEPRHVAQKVGRNDPCPCGSGLKYKKCCGKDQE